MPIIEPFKYIRSERFSTKKILYIEDIISLWDRFSTQAVEEYPFTLKEDPCDVAYPALPESTEPLYRRLANAIEKFIYKGGVRTGDRMPSLRSLSKKYGVSVPTAIQAYLLLETRGMVEVRSRSGVYLKGQQLSSLKQKYEKTTDIKNFLDILIRDAKHSEFVSFGLYAPASRLLPSLKLSRALGSAVRRTGSKYVEYDLISGNFNLRQQIARRALEWGCILGPEDVIITHGSTEALALCLQAICRPGDTIAVESPMSPVVVLMLQKLGIRALEISCYSPNGLIIGELKHLLSQQRVQGLLVTPNFNNPSGALMPDYNKKALVKLCMHHNIPIIEDDIHGDLAFQGKRPLCLKAFDHQDSIMLCGSFSRTLAPSYRVGYVVPGKFYRDVLDRKAVSTFSNATLPAIAIAEFLAHGGYDHHLRGLRKAFSEQIHRIADTISMHFPAGTKFRLPKGGAALWVELPEEIDSYILFESARREKICIAPGKVFSISRSYKNFIRMTCGRPLDDMYQNALVQLGGIAKKILYRAKGNNL